MENEPLFAALRSEPDFQELIHELRTSRDHYRQVYENVRGSFSSYF